MFVPALAAGADSRQLAGASAAFVSFCAAASAVYVLNDLADRKEDLQHPTRRLRPLARGLLNPAWAMVACLLLALLAIIIPSQVTFDLVVLFYLLAGIIYSLWLKKIAGVEMCILVGFYLLRIYGGGIASAVTISGWLWFFAVCIFLYLACLKRLVEFTVHPAGILQRGYKLHHESRIKFLCIISGTGAVGTACLYVPSEDAARYYSSPSILWFAVVGIALWIVRTWNKYRAARLSSDPLVGSLADPASWLAGIVATAAVLLAR